MQVATDAQHFPAGTKLIPLRSEITAHVRITLYPRMGRLNLPQIEAEDLPSLAGGQADEFERLLVAAPVGGRMGEEAGRLFLAMRI